jgi:hypothetical protein
VIGDAWIHDTRLVSALGFAVGEGHVTVTCFGTESLTVLLQTPTCGK